TPCFTRAGIGLALLEARDEACRDRPQGVELVRVQKQASLTRARRGRGPRLEPGERDDAQESQPTCRLEKGAAVDPAHAGIVRRGPRRLLPACRSPHGFRHRDDWGGEPSSPTSVSGPTPESM